MLACTHTHKKTSSLHFQPPKSKEMSGIRSAVIAAALLLCAYCATAVPITTTVSIANDGLLDSMTVTLSEGWRGLVTVSGYAQGELINGTVCSNDIGEFNQSSRLNYVGWTAANVTCTQAGFPTPLGAIAIPNFGETGHISNATSIVMEAVDCVYPSSSTLNDCMASGRTPYFLENVGCTHSNDFGVVCPRSVPATPMTSTNRVTVFTLYFRYDMIFGCSLYDLTRYFMPWALSDQFVEKTDMSPFYYCAVVCYASSNGYTSAVAAVDDLNYAVEKLLASNTTRTMRGVLHCTTQTNMSIKTFFDDPVPPPPKDVVPPPTIVPVSGARNVSGWSFRQRPSSFDGSSVVEALSPQDTVWGTVCYDFARSDPSVAFAICRRILNISIGAPWPYPSPPTLTYGFMMYEVPVIANLSCRSQHNIGGGVAPDMTDFDTDCTFVHLVDVEMSRLEVLIATCLPRRYYAPVMITMAVAADHFDLSSFTSLWAAELNVAVKKVTVVTVGQFGSFKYVNLSFSSDCFPNEASYGNGSAAGDTAMMGDLCGAVASSTDADRLLTHFRVYELRTNTSEWNGQSFSVNSTDWYWRWSPDNGDAYVADMMDLLTQDELYRYRTQWGAPMIGRVEVRIGGDSAWGTMQSSSNGMSSSSLTNLCSLLHASSNIATLIPFPRYGRGAVYISDFNCSMLGSSQCNYTLSTQYEKRNNGSHVDDVGILCGSLRRDLLNGSTIAVHQPIGATPSAPKDTLMCLARVTAIPFERIKFNNQIVETLSEGQQFLATNFSLVKVPNSGSSDTLTTGDLLLLLNATNEWALRVFCNISFVLFDVDEDYSTGSPGVYTAAPTQQSTQKPTVSPATQAVTTTLEPRTPPQQTSVSPIPTSAPSSTTQVTNNGTSAPTTTVATSSPAPAATSAPTQLSNGTSTPTRSPTQAANVSTTGASATTLVPATVTNQSTSGLSNITNAPSTTTVTVTASVVEISTAASLNSSALAVLLQRSLSLPTLPIVLNSSRHGVTWTSLLQFTSPSQALQTAAAINRGELPNVLSATPMTEGSPLQNNNEGSGNNTGVIVGAVVGGVIACGMIALVIRHIVLRRGGSVHRRFDDDFVMATDGGAGGTKSLEEMLCLPDETRDDDDDEFDGADAMVSNDPHRGANDLL